MDNHITFEKAIEMLKLRNMEYHVLELNDCWKTIITQYGGRLLGPFHGDAGESFLWMNGAWKEEAEFGRFIDSREWNLGGERLWVNPELRFFCESPDQFSETYTVQSPLDPGGYQLEQEGGSISLHQDISLTDLSSGEEKDISIRRRYFPAENPLKYIKALRDIKLDFCGYQQEIELACANSGDLTIEPWTVTQVNPGGRFIIPYFGSFDCVDYYGNAPVEAQIVRNGYAELNANGALKYKFGYRAAQTLGRMAFLKPCDSGWQLMLRNYYNDPSLPYCAEPFGELGNRGCSMYFYNDRGVKGGFAEFENSGTPVGCGTMRSRSSSNSTTWFFTGDQGAIAHVMTNLLGIDYKFN